MKTTTSLLATALLFIFYLKAGADVPSSTFANQFLHPKDWSFEQNLGQLTDENGNQLLEIKYFGKFAGAQVYLTTNHLSFVFTKFSGAQNPLKINSKIPVFNNSINKGSLSASRLDLEFEGESPDVQIIPSDRQDATVNYAGAHTAANGINNVSFFKTITYVNIYKKIDMEIIANNQGLEYKFIVHPGGNVADIRVMRKGADAMKMMTNGGIHYETAFGTMDETRPQSFSANSFIGSNFVRNGTSVSFKTENYDHNKDLVIDPGLTWATYFGGDSTDQGYSVALDPTGNVYIAGITKTPKGIATTGAYRTSLAGGVNYDAFLAKFSSAGKLIWSTYYGGDSSDYATTCGLDNAGNIFITGYTNSPDGIATSGAYQTAQGSNPYYLDAFLAKFTSSGKLIWGTYFGGSDNEFVYSMGVDGSGNACILGWTASTSGIATAGSYQTAFGGGQYDAYIAKFTGKGGLSWATYFGGAGDDYGLGLAVDKLKNIYITGSTTSSNRIATAGAFKTSVDTVNGNSYLAMFDSSGNRKWGTYFGGYGGTGDLGFGVSASILNHVYITGNTGNSLGVATKGAYQTSFGGATDVFLADFSTKGALNWATYYGGTHDETGYGISNDSAGNIYIAGATSSGNKIATPDGYQTKDPTAYTTSFLAKFNSSGFLKYGTYYGGNLEEIGRGVANDNNGNVYITGFAASSGIASTGAYQTSNAGQFDVFIAKFLLCNLTTSFTGPNITCPGSVTSYKAVNHANSTYVWTITGGTIKSGAYTDSIAVAWNNSGPASVKLKEVNLTGCLDSQAMTMTIGILPPPPISGDTVTCPSSSVKYKVNPVAGATYAWSVSGGTISGSTSEDSVLVSWPSSAGKGTLTIKETLASGCIAAHSQAITIGSLPPPPIFGDTSVCASGFITYHVNPVSGGTYTWTISNGTISGSKNLDSVMITWQATGGKGTVAIKETNASGCQSTKTETVTIASPLAIPKIKGDSQVCVKSVASFYVNKVSGVSYSWSASAGSINFGQSSDSIAVLWPATPGKGSVTIKESTLSGCHATASLPVSVIALPKPSIIGDTLVCSSGTSTFYANGNPGDTYFWESTGGKITSADNLDTIMVTWQSSTGKGSLLVYETNAIGCQGTTSIPITITTLATPVITGYTQVCPLTTSSYHVKSAPGVTYSWVVNGGNISSLLGRDSIIVLWQFTPGKGKVIIQEASTSGGCKTHDTLNVTIVPNNSVRIKITDNGKGSFLFKTLDSSAAFTGYIWTINGLKFTGYHVQYTFARNGVYSIVLNVTNAAGCLNYFDTTIHVTNAGIVPDELIGLNLSIYPNPFKDQTEIHYTIVIPAKVEITVCDMLGKNVAVLDNQMHEAGDYVAILDGKSNHLTPGIYLVKILVNGNAETEKIVRVKD